MISRTFIGERKGDDMAEVKVSKEQSPAKRDVPASSPFFRPMFSVRPVFRLGSVRIVDAFGCSLRSGCNESKPTPTEF